MPVNSGSNFFSTLQPLGLQTDISMRSNLTPNLTLPDWLPDAVRLYLDHTFSGVSLRALARRDGLHASTILRQVRRYETRRDDPLLDEALDHLAQTTPPLEDAMTAPLRHPSPVLTKRRSCTKAAASCAAWPSRGRFWP